ncbi:MAG: helix-turn-helix domain-containing protein [Quadrisphaera sp.]
MEGSRTSCGTASGSAPTTGASSPPWGGARGLSATEVAHFLGVNKAVVSKSVAVLVERALIVLLEGPRGSRPMYLTSAGAQMHDAMRPISMAGAGPHPRRARGRAGRAV